jgi:MoaA/NifB/PqqE/SkfB family radical SAM enzyme
MRELEEIRHDGTPVQEKTRVHHVRVGKNGALILPPRLLRKLGAAGNDRLEIVENRGFVEVRPSLRTLARVYIEPTSRCNLTCQTCIRNTWTEPLGDMEKETFDRLVGQLKAFKRLESVMFGGFGEPTAHPDILVMIGKVKALGVRAEMTTNGTRLDEPMIDGLLQSRLDRLWVSFDGADETQFETIRKGARFQGLVNSLRLLRKKSARRRKIDVGIAFVVMKRNIDDLKAMDELARKIGADRILVSNVLPYSPDMEKEMLCQLTLTTDTFTFAPGKVEMSLPRLDVSPITREALYRLLQGYENLTLMGNKVYAPSRQCRFIQDRTTFVRWDGQVGPCMGLLHSYKTYLYGNERRVYSYALGDIRRSTLRKIWNSKEYRAFRERLRAFEFSPCHICGGCTLVEENKEDCFGNTFPVCGACLWAQGVIQCP